MFSPIDALGAFSKGFQEVESPDKFFDQLGISALAKTFQQPPQQGPIDQMNGRGPQPPMPGQPSMPAQPPMLPPGMQPPGAGGSPPGMQSPQGPSPGSPQARINDTFQGMGFPPQQPPQGPVPSRPPAGAPPPQQQIPAGSPAAGGGGGPMQRGMALEDLAARIKQVNPNLPPRALFSALVRGQALLNGDAKAALTDFGRQVHGLSPRRQDAPQYGGHSSALKAGHVTTFRNGQRWTIINGRPVHVGMADDQDDPMTAMGAAAAGGSEDTSMPVQARSPGGQKSQPYPFDFQTPESFAAASKAVPSGDATPYFLPNTVNEFRQAYGRNPASRIERRFYYSNPAAEAAEQAKPDLDRASLERAASSFSVRDGGPPVTLGDGRYNPRTDKHDIQLNSILDYKPGMRGQRALPGPSNSPRAQAPDRAGRDMSFMAPRGQDAAPPAAQKRSNTHDPNMPATRDEFRKQFGRDPDPGPESALYGDVRHAPGFMQWPATIEGFKKRYGREPATDAEMEHYYPDALELDDDADDKFPPPRRK